MNFHELRIIVSQLKKNIACPQCKGKYTDEDLEIIGALGDEHTFFYADCSNCDAQSVVNVNVQFEHHHGESLERLPKLGTAPRMGHIEANEVLDMHNFLKEFEGDFSKLFKS